MIKVGGISRTCPCVADIGGVRYRKRDLDGIDCHKMITAVLTEPGSHGSLKYLQMDFEVNLPAETIDRHRPQ